MNNPIPFMQPRMVGERFQGHAIPLEMLKDLAVLEEMIVEVAKWCFLQDHPGRQRSPRGFTDGLSLKLTGIGEGSAVPQVSLFVDTRGAFPAEFFPPENQGYFEQARDCIYGAINAAANDESITAHLPENLLGYFDRLGRGLRDGEVIEFNPGNAQRPARLDRSTRRKLIFASSQTQELTEEISLCGSVPEADQERMTFTLRLLDGQRVSGPIAFQHLDTINKAYLGYQSGVVRIQIQGIGRYNRSNRLKSIDEVEHVSILDPLDVATQLDEFRSLKNGWLDGKGRAPSQEGLDWFSGQFEGNYPEVLPLPYIYPTAEGGVQAEWPLNGNEASLEVDFETHRGEWYCLNMSTDAEDDNTLNLNDAESWRWLATRIRELAGGAKGEQ
ncbi:MAG: hypothetical protein HQL07_03800 [Nitrospirae bacterium]|nr:hypothetical protein [Magnetococcales bacterium]HAT48844.1 hypothetical protein [Alphaproteobacteria bacterium]